MLGHVKNNTIYLSPPHMGEHELKFVEDAFRSNWIAPLGPYVDTLEREFASLAGTESAAALSSGTAALHLACAGWICNRGMRLFALR
jgi:pyridoxal phosphate-dependent aminotransferase EpsN